MAVAVVKRRLVSSAPENDSVTPADDAGPWCFAVTIVRASRRATASQRCGCERFANTYLNRLFISRMTVAYDQRGPRKARLCTVTEA